MADPLPLDFIPKPTPQLVAALTELRATIPEADFTGLIAQLRASYARQRAWLLKFEPGAVRGAELHRLIDGELLGAAGLNITCRRGCAGCCHYEVEVTDDELALLKKAVEGGIEIDRSRLAAQAARERKSPKWTEFGNAENRCVFLDEANACKIYADRPSACRKHLVTSPPINCTTPDAVTHVVRILSADILLSAAVSLEGVASGTLPKMLQAALQDRL